MFRKYIFILFCFLTFSTFAQKKESLDTLFTKVYTDKEFNGNVLIAEKGNVIYSNSFGLRNERTQEKLNEKSIFELASVSKQFTAFGIVLLKEKGKLLYEDEISKHIPELSFYKGVTIKHLLTHTSGLPDYMQLLDSLVFNDNSKGKIATNKDIVNLFSSHKPALLFNPNTQYQYSNTGYAILASIIEKVSNKSFSEFLKDEIFIPLKMHNTFVYRRRFEPKKIENYAFGYVYNESSKQNVLPDDEMEYNYVYNLDGIVGDGTVNSTVNDLFLWNESLKNQTLVSENAINDIFSDYELNNGKFTEYGFGWRVEDNGLFGKIAYHGGSWPGYKTYIEKHIDNDILIVLLQNNDNENIWFPIRQIRQIIYEIAPIKYITVNSDLLNKFVGEYEYNNGSTHKVTTKDNSLYVLIYGDEMELKPISQTKFHLIGFSPDVFFEFSQINNEIILRQTQPELKIDIEAKKK